jgi:hypothetical protein
MLGMLVGFEEGKRMKEEYYNFNQNIFAGSGKDLKLLQLMIYLLQVFRLPQERGSQPCWGRRTSFKCLNMHNRTIFHFQM